MVNFVIINGLLLRGLTENRDRPASFEIIEHRRVAESGQ